MFVCTHCHTNVELGARCSKCGGFMAMTKGGEPFYHDGAIDPEKDSPEDVMSEPDVMTALISMMSDSAPEKVTRLERMTVAVLRATTVNVWRLGELTGRLDQEAKAIVDLARALTKEINEDEMTAGGALE